MNLSVLIRALSLIVIFSIVSEKSLSQDSRSIGFSKLTGSDEQYEVDVILRDGKHALVTDGRVTIDQIFGSDPQATTYFFIGTETDTNGVGLAGDTVTVTIPSAPAPHDTLYPAVSAVTTVDAAMLADDRPERALAIKICENLDLTPNFKISKWKCEVMKDYSGVFISSTIMNAWGERTTWDAVPTGTTRVTKAFVDIERRGYATELTRSPNDPRLGVLEISGSFALRQSSLDQLLIEEFKDSLGNHELNIDGSTPVDFFILCDNVLDKFVSEIRIFAGCNGLKFGQFLCKNSNITNGIDVVYSTDGNDTMLANIKSTEDFKNRFSFSPAGTGSAFRIDVQAGGDEMVASFILPTPAFIGSCGSGGVTVPDDFLRITINDNLSSGVAALEGLVQGFTAEP